MATKKISELTPLDPSANLELTFIPVFDDVSDTTRKITLKQINDAIEASIPIAEAAYTQANTATTNAATADQKALSAGNYANSAFVRANNSLNVSVGGTITGDVIFNGNVTVSGCTASLQVSTLRTNDPVLDLSFGTVGNPTQNAGIRILRGDELPVQVRWNETSDKWQFTNDGTSYTNLGEIIGLDNDFIVASSNTANTGNLIAQLAYDNSNSSYLLANLNAQLSLANYNSIQAFGNGTGTITVTSVTANTLTFGGSLYANAAYDAANTADQRAVTSGDYANASYSVANTADQRAVTSGSYANSAYALANTADQRAVTSGDYANSSYFHANAVFNLANTFTTEASTSGDYANSAFGVANTADQRAVTSGDYANSAFGVANTADQRAVTSGDYANSGYALANTADQRAVTSGDYANSGYALANTADQRAVTSGDYANSAFVEANSASSGVITADQRAVTAGDYANSAYLLANVADQRAVTSGSYANAAFNQANTGVNPFDQDLNTSNNVIFNRITTTTGEVYVNIGNTFLITTTSDGSTERTLSFDTFGTIRTHYGIQGQEGLLLAGDIGEAYSSLYLPKDSSSNTQAVQIYNLNETGNITLSANASNWTFNHNGNLIFPNSAEIRDVGGDLRLRAAPGEVTQLQGIDSSGFVDSAVKTFYNSGGYVTINTNIDASEHIWTFDPNGDLTVPNYINFAGTTYIGDEPGAGTPTFRIVAPLNYGVTIETDSDISGNNCVWTFGENADLTFPDSTIQTTAFTTSPTLDVLKINDGVHEQYQMKGDATGTVEHDCSSGHIFYHISPDANWTANFTNLNLDSAYVTAVTLIIAQGGTGYYPNAVQIGGVPQTINWQNNTTPTPSTNRTDVVTFSILNTGTGYLVLGQLTGF